MERISSITLQGIIPKVFVGDADHCIDGSDVWYKDVVLHQGNIYRIEAGSGTGKTSLCSFLYGVRNDYEGEIYFNDINIRSMSLADWCKVRRMHISYLSQELDIFPELSAIDNVLLKNRLTDFYSESQIRILFERFGIDNRVDAMAGRLSVGQRQRVALIRAFCQPFEFMLLDEPVSHLDLNNNKICAEVVAEEASRRSASVVFTSVGNSLDMPDGFITFKL